MDSKAPTQETRENTQGETTVSLLSLTTSYCVRDQRELTRICHENRKASGTTPKVQVELNPDRNQGEKHAFKETERRKSVRQSMVAEACGNCKAVSPLLDSCCLSTPLTRFSRLFSRSRAVLRSQEATCTDRTLSPHRSTY